MTPGEKRRRSRSTWALSVGAQTPLGGGAAEFAALTSSRDGTLGRGLAATTVQLTMTASTVNATRLISGSSVSLRRSTPSLANPIAGFPGTKIQVKMIAVIRVGAGAEHRREHRA